MVSKGQGAGEAQLERQIGCVKSTVFCFNVVTWIIGAAMFGVSVWMRSEPVFQEWVKYLQMSEFYIGVYILICVSCIVMLISFIGCGAALMENIMGLYIYIGLQLFSFVCGAAGAAVLLDYSTYDSSIQPIIRNSMNNLIANSQNENVTVILRILQENIGCCGASGPMDYVHMKKPLPTECRDTVTGHAFYYGCVDELTWFLEDRSGWLAGLALSLCMLHIILAVMSLILIQALKKEEETATYKH